MDRLELTLECIFVALVYIGVILTALLYAYRKIGRRLAGTAQMQLFLSEARSLLNKGDYGKLREVAMEREATHPGDATAHYFLGMAHLRSNELILAKACFEQTIKLDANWKKVCVAHLEKIAAELKKAKPVLVDKEGI